MSGRVVVTAAGVISAIGAGLESFGCALYSGARAARPSARFPGLSTAEIVDFNAQQWLGKGIRAMDRSARLLAVAAHMALDGAGLSQETVDTGDPELGLVCGSVYGSVHSIAAFDWTGITEGPTYVNPMEFPNTVINAPAGQAAIKHKLRGVNSTVCAGTASSLHAIHYAAEFLRFGRARALLAGGVEELSEESALAFRQDGACVPGEGAALWLLETDDTAQARGRSPWIEVCGFGSVHGDNAADTVRQALADAGIQPEQIACIMLSTACRSQVPAEAQALYQVFGDGLSRTPLCATKAAFGEALGASGALSAIAAGLALQQQMLPPTAGPLDDMAPLVLSGAPLPIAGDYALINAFGSDGNNAALVIRLWKN